MRVNGIELLQMIKDKKVPYNTLIDVSGGTNLMHPNMSLHEDNSLYWEWANGSQIVLTNDLLEYNFEIIELTEEIEGLEYDHNFYSQTEYSSLKNEDDKGAYLLRGINESIGLSLVNKNKINKLVKEINRLERNNQC